MPDKPTVYKPTKEELFAAGGRAVPDVIAPQLKVLFCGINPGLYSAAVGHHFARPGNRFWKALHDAGFTDRLLSPFEEHELLKLGYGLTNLVARATAGAGDLNTPELVDGAHRLTAKVQEFRPAFVAVLGMGAYRKAFSRPEAQIGPQGDKIGESVIWVLPSPSGINGRYPLDHLVRLCRELLLAVREAPKLSYEA